MGISYRRLGEPNKAATQLESALRLRRELQSGGNPQIVGNLLELAIAQRDAGQLEQSNKHFIEAQQMMAALGESDLTAKAKLLVEIGRLETLRSHAAEALASFNSALELMKTAKGPRDPEVGSILSEIANIYTWMDDYPHAEAAARQAVEIYSDVDTLHPDRVKADFILAETLLYQGRIDAAAPIYERTLAAQRALYKSNSKVAETLSSLAHVRLAQGDTTAAEALVREAITTHRNSGSTSYEKVGFLQTMLGMVLLKQARYDEARTVLTDTLDLFAKSLPPDHQYVASAEHYLGEALAGSGKLADAEAMLTAAANRWKRTTAPEWRSARSASALGEVLHREGKNQQAEQYLVSSFKVIAAAPGVDAETRKKSLERITRFYTEVQQRNKLDAFLRDTGPATSAPN